LPAGELDFSLLPEELRDVAPLIEKFSESDDARREDLLEGASDEELRVLVEAPSGRWDAINAFLDEYVEEARDRVGRPDPLARRRRACQSAP
jgi:hypothetical protein